MSIVERALQKAQAKGRQESAMTPAAGASDVGKSIEVVAPSEPPTSIVADPSGASLPSFGVPDAASRTSFDAKAIVHLDFARLRDEGRVPSSEMTRQVEEEMRRVKWPVLNAIEGRGGEKAARNNVVLVTSAVPGEGKTFTSLNLALSIVRDRESRVVLVDGDVARPGLTPTLGLEGRPGLNEVLEDTAMDVEAVIYRTDIDGLFFVPAGRWHDHSPEFFAGSRMPQVIEELSRRVGNGVIIFDSPPLLATNDAQALTRYAGQVLLVVRSDDTEQQAVLDALALVDRTAVVSAVLNRVSPSIVSRYYGQYYYGYNYGQGRSSESEPGKGNA
jgi:receptor protein-tyrosine kinase